MAQNSSEGLYAITQELNRRDAERRKANQVKDRADNLRLAVAWISVLAIHGSAIVLAISVNDWIGDTVPASVKVPALILALAWWLASALKRDVDKERKAL